MSTELSAIERIQQEPMQIRQWYIVAICIGILAIDGYDVLSIAFAAPGFSAEWGISKTVLGIVLPAELAGMALGSLIMGPMADSKGRRPTMLLGLVILTIGMAVSSVAPNIYILGLARVFTGIGIGGLIPTSTATCSEFCNNKNRSLAVILVASGFSFGIYLGATFLSPLLMQYDWRVTFHLGAFFSLLFIPLVYFCVPETIVYLERKRPKDALTLIQKTMRRLKHTIPTELQPVEDKKVELVGVKHLFKGGLAVITCLLIFAYIMNILTYYYFMKWLPTIVFDLGYTASEASQVLGVISLGGVIGSISMSILARFIAIKKLIFFSLIISAVGVATFPYFTESLASMKQAGFFTGAFLFASTSAFIVLIVDSFPSSLLGSGSGVVVGFGRAGAILGPMIPGFLFAASMALESVALIMAAGSFLAGIAVLFMIRQKLSSK